MERLKDDLPNLAFELAYFIHLERETAKKIVTAAMESLETTTLSQDKRFYYSGRRTKVSFSEAHLLQKLVYEKSDPFEQQRESDAVRPLNQERLLVHFIKYLVWISVQRKSLYVTLGISRLLHRYTTPETMEIYNVIMQDPDRVPAEDYFRNRKKVLMDQLLERFGKFVMKVQGPHGAIRFATHDQSEPFAAIVADCLSAFTPWRTICHIPEHFVPTDKTLDEFIFTGSDFDQEHVIEINRYHALIDPGCFARLLRGLGYAAPVERLEIPIFQAAIEIENGDSGSQPPSNQTKLTTRENDELNHYLRDRERRRKTTKAKLLRFVANGKEAARLNLRENSSVRFRLSNYPEFLEIRSREAPDDLLLARHRLFYDDNDRLLPQDVMIVLENGQNLHFQIAPADETIAVTCESGLTASERSLWSRLQEGWGWMADLSRPRWQPAAATAFLAILTVGAVYFVLNRPQRSELARVPPASPPSVSPTAISSPAPQPSAPIDQSETQPKTIAVVISKINVDRNRNSITRGQREKTMGLIDARQVYLEIKGDDALRGLVRRRVQSELQKRSGLILTNDREAGDIALKIQVRRAASKEPKDQITLTAKITDANGDSLWPLETGVEALQYKGATVDVINSFSSQLSRDLKKLRR